MDRRVVLMLVKAADLLPVSAEPVATTMGSSMATDRITAMTRDKSLLFFILSPLFAVDNAVRRGYTDYRMNFAAGKRNVRNIMIFFEILHFLTFGFSWTTNECSSMSAVKNKRAGMAYGG